MSKKYTPEKIAEVLKQNRMLIGSDANANPHRQALIDIVEWLQIELSEAREVRDIANIAAESYRSRIVNLEEALHHDG